MCCMVCTLCYGCALCCALCSAMVFRMCGCVYETWYALCVCDMYMIQLCVGPQCGQIFAHKGNLTVHLHSHNENKRFKCHFKGCEHRFVKKQNLENHIRTHTGEKPFVCDICDRGFSQVIFCVVRDCGIKNFLWGITSFACLYITKKTRVSHFFAFFCDVAQFFAFLCRD